MKILTVNIRISYNVSVILSGALRNVSPREAQSKDPDAAHITPTLRAFLPPNYALPT